MAIRLDKAWQPLRNDDIARLPAQLGVYEIADADGTVRRIDYAGGRALFGLRSALLAEADARGEQAQFRYEITMQYMSRWQELLMAHVADHGALPVENMEHRPRVLGRLSPG